MRIISASETSQVVKGVVEETKSCKREGVAETILFNLTGHGHFDMVAYKDYFSGKTEEKNYDVQKLSEALSKLPQVAVS